MGMIQVSLFLRHINIGNRRAAFALQSRAVPDEQSDAEPLERAEAALTAVQISRSLGAGMRKIAAFGAVGGGSRVEDGSSAVQVA
jgi:hypothetical protein